MWFSYPNQEDWIPLKVDRVKEIMAMNKKGQKPSNLKDEAVELLVPAVVEKIHDYENVVGQDSLTRLDEKPRNKNNRNNRPKPAGTGRPERTNKTGQPAQRAASPQVKPQQNNQKAAEHKKPGELKKPTPVVRTEEGAEAKAPAAGRNNRSRNNRRRNKPADKPRNEES